MGSVADHEVEPWVFSRKVKLGSSDVFIGGMGCVTHLIFLKLQESWSKFGHAAIEMVTVYSVTVFFISNCILLLTVAGQIDKTPPPHGRCLNTSLS